MAEIRIGKKLSELRSAKGITQDELAAAMGVSNKTVSKWETGDSFPDLETLVALAGYYEVSTDSLLGLGSGTKDTAAVISEEFRGLNKRESALKLFDIIRDSFPAIFSTAVSGNTDEKTDAIPEKTAAGTRYSLTMREMFDFLVCSDDVNFAVVELCNKANYGWLIDEEKQKNISGLLSFLSDTDVMKILYFIHSTDCSTSFTAEYMSKKTNVEAEKTEKILSRCCDIGLCSVMTAHLKNGEVEVYESFGDGLLLAVLSVAYEITSGSCNYNYFNGGSLKVIRGRDQI